MDKTNFAQVCHPLLLLLESEQVKADWTNYAIYSPPVQPI